MAIQSFTDAEAECFFRNESLPRSTGWKALSGVAARKLDMLHYASDLSDLKAPPGNRLEKLKGDLDGMYSIRINDQWRIVFRWNANGPSEVRIVDYHK